MFFEVGHRLISKEITHRGNQVIASTKWRQSAASSLQIKIGTNLTFEALLNIPHVFLRINTYLVYFQSDIRKFVGRSFCDITREALYKTCLSVNIVPIDWWSSAVKTGQFIDEKSSHQFKATFATYETVNKQARWFLTEVFHNPNYNWFLKVCGQLLKEEQTVPNMDGTSNWKVDNNRHINTGPCHLTE